MGNVIDNITGGYKSFAKVNAGTLVLSLPDAITPIVWRMDLSIAKSSAVEIRENENGFYDLVLKTPKADAHKIASYEFKIKATQALMAITKAMSKCDYSGSHDKLTKRHLPVPVSYNEPKPIWLKIVTYSYITLSLAVFAYMGYSFYSDGYNKVNSKNTVSYQRNDKYKDFLNDNPLEQPKPVARSADKPRSQSKSKTGEVMSADDFLKKR